MKKLVLIIFFALLAAMIPNIAHAIEVEDGVFIYDQTLTIQSFFKKNINIYGQQLYEKENVRLYYYIDDKLNDNTSDEIMAKQLESVGRGARESVMIVGYSRESDKFYVVHNPELVVKDLEDKVADIYDNYFSHYHDRWLGDALMQVYGYFAEIVRESYQNYSGPVDYDSINRRLFAEKVMIIIILIIGMIWELPRGDMRMRIWIFSFFEILITVFACCQHIVDIPANYIALSWTIFSALNIVTLVSPMGGPITSIMRFFKLF